MKQGVWRRTAFMGLDRRTQALSDDWSLLNPAGQPIARIYKTTGGPRDGHWFWTVLVGPDGRMANGGTGYCEDGRAAKNACEQILARAAIAV